jgi:hypothetical protein
MKARIVSLTLVLALSAVTATVNADDKTNTAASQRFEALKGLAGDWVEIGKDGKPTDKVVSSIRVTSAGSTVQETLFPGSDHEMVTMYHLDGAELVLTHYCMLGNQPRMRAEAGDDVKKIVFKFIGGTNLKSEDEQHMHQATLTIKGKDRFEAEWIACKDGKACHEVRFDLARKQK